MEWRRANRLPASRKQTYQSIVQSDERAALTCVGVGRTDKESDISGPRSSSNPLTKHTFWCHRIVRTRIFISARGMHAPTDPSTRTPWRPRYSRTTTPQSLYHRDPLPPLVDLDPAYAPRQGAQESACLRRLCHNDDEQGKGVPEQAVSLVRIRHI